jgi:hypothetical protein
VRSLIILRQIGNQRLHTGVLPKSSTRWKVGRAVLCTPQEFGKTGTFRGSPGTRGARGATRSTTELLGQHALTSSPTASGNLSCQNNHLASLTWHG